MIRITAAIIALSSIVSLSACSGAGQSEFATKATAACVKDQGEASAAKCGCQVKVIEAALNDKEKKFLLASMDAQALGPEAGMKALTESGLTMADMAAMGAKMQGLDTKSEAACGK